MQLLNYETWVLALLVFIVALLFIQNARLSGITAKLKQLKASANQIETRLYWVKFRQKAAAVLFFNAFSKTFYGQDFKQEYYQAARDEDGDENTAKIKSGRSELQQEKKYARELSEARADTVLKFETDTKVILKSDVLQIGTFDETGEMESGIMVDPKSLNVTMSKDGLFKVLGTPANQGNKKPAKKRVRTRQEVDAIAAPQRRKNITELNKSPEKRAIISEFAKKRQRVNGRFVKGK